MRLGVVGGSSLVKFDAAAYFKGVAGWKFVSQKDTVAKTEFGPVDLREVELSENGEKHTIIFMQRHGHSGGGITPPHRINHKANMMALVGKKVDMILATSSVGTIHSVFPPGRVGVARQYIDLTGVATTYHEDDAKFTSVTQPFDPELNKVLLKTLRRAQKLRADTKLELVTWLSPGPLYETEAEVTAAERLGADVVGMTAPREAKLTAELGVRYACLCIASNWAAGRHPGDPTMALSHEEVSEMSARTTSTIIACIVDVLGQKGAEPSSVAPSPKRASSAAERSPKRAKK